MEFLLLIVFVILGFAFYGFVCLCLWIAKHTGHSPRHNQPENKLDRYAPDETADVRGAERLLNHFYLASKIDDAQYNRIRDILEQDYSESLTQKYRLQKTADGVQFVDIAEPVGQTEEPSVEQTEVNSLIRRSKAERSKFAERNKFADRSSVGGRSRIHSSRPVGIKLTADRASSGCS